MSRHKPDSDRRCVIVDLSWPLGASVNAGIDKTTYLDSRFDLTFPTIDDITNELKALGKGALLYKIDISQAFHHVKIDPSTTTFWASSGMAFTLICVFCSILITLALHCLALRLCRLTVCIN